MSNARRTRHPRTPRLSPHEGEGRALGLDDREIPGGENHLVNHETQSAKPPAMPDRTIPPMNEHGVADPAPDKPYDQPRAGKTRRPVYAELPPEDTAVPVYLVQRGSKARRVIRYAVMSKIAVPKSGSDPIRIAGDDPERISVTIKNNADIIDSSAVTDAGSTTGPAAATVLATCTVPAGSTPGLWEILSAYSFEGSGVVAGTDSNNVVIKVNGVVVATVITDVAAVNANSFPLSSYGRYVLKAGDVITMVTVAATASTVTYQYELLLSPVSGGASGTTDNSVNVAATAAEVIEGGGYQLDAGDKITLTSQNEFWACALGNLPVQISVALEVQEEYG